MFWRELQCVFASGTIKAAFPTTGSFLVDYGKLAEGSFIAPDCRDVLGPLSVQSFGSLLQLVQLVLDHFDFVTVSALLCHCLKITASVLL